MDRFSKAHPALHFVFFIVVFLLSVSVYNPVFSAISFVGAFLYDAKIRGKKALSDIGLMLAIVFVVSIFNMLFSHYGEDVLFVFNGRDYTLEALFYGFNQGLVLSAILIWFAIYSRITDSEKIIYVLRFAPKCAIIFSMVLGFIPRFTKKFEDIRDAQLGLNGGKEDYSFPARLKQSISNLSALVTYSLESSVHTAESMNARGYNPKAIRASRYKISKRDILLLILSLLAFIIILYEKSKEYIRFVFEPKIYFDSFSIIAVVLFSMICLLPVVVDLTEDILWKISTSKK